MAQIKGPQRGEAVGHRAWSHSVCDGCRALEGEDDETLRGAEDHEQLLYRWREHQSDSKVEERKRKDRSMRRWGTSCGMAEMEDAVNMKSRGSEGERENSKTAASKGTLGMHARSRDPNLLFSSGSIATLLYNNQLILPNLTYRCATSKYRAVRISVSFNQSPSLVCNRDVSHPLKKACTTDRQTDRQAAFALALALLGLFFFLSILRRPCLLTYFLFSSGRLIHYIILHYIFIRFI